MAHDRYEKARVAFNLFFQKSGREITVDQISKATGWSHRTVEDYYSKKWSRWGIMKKIGRGVYDVRIPADLDEKLFVELHSQNDSSVNFQSIYLTRT
ncbi:hypothetical protein ACQKQC_27175 [Vibrio fortis]|uniref:hypothetical protein n=1 Tax=Vibrio fortis TaxID=212667 RepID=UPI0040693DD1